MRARVWVGAVSTAGLLVGTALGPLAVAQQANSTTGTVMPGALPLDLKVRRVRDGVEVVIENACHLYTRVLRILGTQDHRRTDCRLATARRHRVCVRFRSNHGHTRLDEVPPAALGPGLWDMSDTHARRSAN